MNKRTNNAPWTKRAKTFAKHEWLNLGLIVVTLVFASFVVTPKDVFADVVQHPTPSEQKATTLMISAMQNTFADYGAFPAAGDRPAPRKMIVTATAYNSEVGQTDSTPFITASGTTVRDGVIAANFLRIGTRVKIGDKMYVVEDRMNKRYDKRIDIWMESKADAKQFGVRNVEIEIYD